MQHEEKESYGIDIERAHSKAKELIPNEFFWDSTDELAPFGSDEGDIALAEYRTWRQENPKSSIVNCIRWVIEDVGEMDFEDYDEAILNKEQLEEEIADTDKKYDIFNLDISIIATGFGQLVDEGKIDKAIIPIVELAVHRQKLRSQISKEQGDWEYADQYLGYLKVLENVLEKMK